MTNDELDHIRAAWLAHHQYLGHQQTSITRRTWALRQWITATNGQLENATSEDLEKFLMTWPSPATRHAVLSDLRQLYEWGTRRGYLTTNPTLDVTSPRIPKRLPTPVSHDDVMLLLSTTAAPVRTMIALAALAGLRMFEIAALTTQDVNVRDALLTVRSGKGAKDSVLPMSPRLVGELAGWPAGPYFPGLDRRAVAYRIQKAMRRRQIYGRPHDLRAAYGTELARLTNGNVVLVRQLMRHESVVTTMRYIGWTPEATSAIAQIFAA